DRSVTLWMKRIYKEVKLEIDNKLTKLYHELSQFLHLIPPAHAEIFVKRLTSYQLYGQSIKQLSDKYHYTVEDIQLLLIGLFQYLLDELYQKPSAYPLLR